MNINDFLQIAAEIRDEQLPNANSALRIGSLFYSLVEILSEIVQANPDIGTTPIFTKIKVENGYIKFLKQNDEVFEQIRILEILENVDIELLSIYQQALEN